MALNEYVSAEWIDDGMGGKIIRAVGDDDSVWFIASLDSDVSPWPEWLKENGVAAITGVPPSRDEPT